MPFKLFGSLALVISGIFAGFACARREKSAFLQTQALCTALRDMSARIRGRNAALPELARELCERGGTADGIFKRTVKLYDGGEDFSRAAAEACALIEDDRARSIALSLFTRAEMYDCEEALRRFDTAIRELEARAEELKKKYEGKAPLARRLGAAAGICAAILFI